MMENTKVYTQQLNIRHRKQRIRYRVLTFLAAVVVFITTYAMIIPAITWERTLLCEIPEHTHGEACWQDEMLICGMEEHVHDTACFDAPPRLHDDYLCGMSEHAHTEDCYFEDGTLRCTLIEHIHDDTCTAETKDYEKLLTDEASADAMAPDGLLPEAPAASLLNAGAEPGEPDDPTAPEDPPVPEDPLDMDEYITSVTIQRRENANEEWVPVDQYVHENDQLRIQFYYELPAETLSDNNYKVSYQIDPSIKVLHETSGTVPGPDGKPAGKYTVTEDGVVTIVFDHEYVEMNQNGSKLNGFVTFYSTVESMGGKEDEELVFPFKEIVTVTVKNPEGDLSVEKASKNVKPTEGTLDYEIVVSSENGTYAPVILKDTLTNADVVGDITIVTPEGENVSYEGTFPDITLPALEKGGQYIITYSAALDSEHKLPQVQTITNKVTVESKNSLDEPLYDDDEQSDSFSRPSITKQGIYNSAFGTIDWTITINSSSSTRHDLSGWTLSDDFEGNVLDPNLDVVIKPNPLTGKDSIKTHLPYVFPQDSAVTYYSVTYRTNGNPDSKNQAMLTPPSGEGITTGPVGTYSFEISKSPLGIYADHNNEAGDIIVRQEWLLTVDTTNGAVFANIVSPFADISPANHPETFPNGGYWSMSDTLNNGQPTYITEELQRENARRIAEEIKNSGYEGSFYIFTGQGNNASINDTLIYRTEEGSDAWDFMADNPITEGTLHLYIIFDSNYGPGKIMDLHYSNYMNVQDGTVTGIYGSNFIYVRDANSAINTGVSQWYSPVAIKYDSKDHNGGQITEHRLEEVIFKQGDHEAYTPIWDLRIHLPLQEYTEPVTIKEVLPEGTKLYTLGKTNFSTYISLSCSETIDGVSNYLFHSGSLLALDDAVQTSKPYGTDAYSCGKDGHGYVTSNGYRIDYFYNPELTEISFCIPPELANVIKGKDMSISGIIAEIIDPEWSGVYHAYDNHVTVSYGDTVIGHAEQTQKIKHTVIKKTAGGVVDGNTVPYSIVINPSASDLDPASAVLTVTDMLSYTPPAGTVMNASLSSVVIYALSTGDRGEEIRTDITSACSYTMDESAEGGKQTYTVRFKVPDSTSIRIDYEYQFSGKGKVHDLTNVAMVEGGKTGSDETKNELDIIIQDADSGVVAVGINVHKVDSENYTVTLGGAEFKLEKWTGQSWVIVENPTDPEHGFVTDETHGMFNTGALENNTAYRLTELKAPPGYEMRTATTYEFYIKSFDSSSIVKPENFNGKALNNGDNFYITNDAVRYDLPSTGGNGTVHYELIGSMILLFVFLYSLRLKKRQTKHEIKK